jgi:hypothetical protein
VHLPVQNHLVRQRVPTFVMHVLRHLTGLLEAKISRNSAGRHDNGDSLVLTNIAICCSYLTTWSLSCLNLHLKVLQPPPSPLLGPLLTPPSPPACTSASTIPAMFSAGCSNVGCAHRHHIQSVCSSCYCRAQGLVSPSHLSHRPPCRHSPKFSTEWPQCAHTTVSLKHHWRLLSPVRITF